MNAGLQCLIHCNYLTLYFLNTYHKFEEIKSQSKIVQEYVKFLNLYSNDSSASVNPQELISLFLNEMTDYECILLAGIPNAPSVYAPTKNPELAIQRQKQVMNKMVEYEYLTQEEANILEQNGY